MTAIAPQECSATDLDALVFTLQQLPIPMQLWAVAEMLRLVPEVDGFMCQKLIGPTEVHYGTVSALLTLDPTDTEQMRRLQDDLPSMMWRSYLPLHTASRTALEEVCNPSGTSQHLYRWRGTVEALSVLWGKNKQQVAAWWARRIIHKYVEGIK